MRTYRSQQTNGGHDEEPFHCAECRPMEEGRLPPALSNPGWGWRR